MTYFQIAIVALLLICAGLVARPEQSTAAQDESPVVIELFTSQSCSSCPPADRLLGELAQRPNIIALSCHVTYWDHLGWKDTLSNDFCTQRQYAYSGNGRVYTPQMIVNGADEFTGSNRGRAEAAIRKAAANPLPRITLVRMGENLHITLPGLPARASPPVVTLFSIGDSLEQSIGSGENGGRSVSYVNPVQRIESLAAWDGKATSFDVKPGIVAPRYTVIVQDGPAGPVIAAGKI